jgi:hypothetical protein
VELDAASDHHARVGQRARLVGGREQHMQRRHPRGLRMFEQRRDERRAGGRIDGQQTRSTHRRERDRRQQLRVVAQAVPLVGVGPRPVEHVLAVRMALAIERHRTA